MPQGKKRELGKFPSGTRYSTVGCEFNVNEATMLYFPKEEEEICWSVHEMALEGANITPKVFDKAMEKMKKRLRLWIWVMATNKKA